jgi:DNA-binding NtrC family response regulator
VTNQIGTHQATERARLQVIEGQDCGKQVTIPPVGIVVGADPAVDVTLSDAAISGRHCTIIPKENGFSVKDLESKNGTFLDNVAISEALVPVGGVLRLGKSLIQLMPGEEVVEIPPSTRTHFGKLAGESLAMRRVYALLERAAQSDASVLFIGESGTGKELASRAIHENSPRKKGPFVVFDCGAASDTLIASDLFGHVRGAFTGADRERVGAFAAAHKGTLFLDEIGDLPLNLQPKLLRLLETGEVTRLGTTQHQKYDVRIVAATNRNLWEEVSRGTFRGDLYYRLAVVEVHLPPLRQHKEDIESLTKLFLKDTGASDEEIAGPNLERLHSYQWPGNVRELRNVVTRAVALSPPGAAFSEMPILLRPGSTGAATGAGGGTVSGTAAAQAHSFGAQRTQKSPLSAISAFSADRPFHEVKGELVAEFERAYLADLLKRAEGNLSQAARIAGLERKYLYKLLDKHGMR